MIQITTTGAGVHVTLSGLLHRMGNPRAGLKAIGELVVEFTKNRFAVSQDPYGTPWAPNRPSTLEALLGSHPKNLTSKGKVSARGARLLIGKKPLIGETKSLMSQFHWRVEGNAVEIRSSMIYAAMQQFGGRKANFPHLWGDIPARPFFPDAARGFPSPLEARIVKVLQDAILGGSS